MYCRNCGNEVNEKAVACMKCGADPRTEKKFCPSCGVETNPKQVICTKCGISLENKSFAFDASNLPKVDVKGLMKNKTVLTGIGLVVIGFSVYFLLFRHSFSSDVKRYVEITCSAQKMMSSGTSIADLQKLSLEYQDELMEIAKRHIDDAEEFSKACRIALVDCQ